MPGFQHYVNCPGNFYFMTVLEVTFQKNYHISLEDRFLMETLIIKVMGDVAEEKDAQILWDKARVEADLNHRLNNPHLFKDTTPDIPILSKKDIAVIEELKKGGEQFQENKKNQLESTLTLEDQIKSCTESKVLESYKFIVKGKPELQEIYDSRLAELNQELYNNKLKELS